MKKLIVFSAIAICSLNSAIAQKKNIPAPLPAPVPPTPVVVAPTPPLPPLPPPPSPPRH